MNWDQVINELTFRTSRSSGPGGQHVNKTESKVDVMFDVNKSKGLSEEEKEIIMQKLMASINSEGVLIQTSQKFRSQLSNKEDAIERLKLKIDKALVPKAKRLKTKPSKASVEERLTEKKQQSEKKSFRKKPNL